MPGGKEAAELKGPRPRRWRKREEEGREKGRAEELGGVVHKAVI